jgi:hypothetical protein
VCVCECLVVGKKIGINRIDQINIQKLLRTLQYGTIQEETVRYGTEEKKRKVGEMTKYTSFVQTQNTPKLK